MIVRVLIVDDEPDVETLFRQQFRREVRQELYILNFALSGKAALDILDGHIGAEIILLISDINMPGMTGLELLPVVKQRRPGLPVFMISDAMEDRGLPIMSGTKIPDPIGRSSARARRLIAVVHADMVGYSHLIGLDDVGTLDRLRMLRRTLIDPTIDEHGGRIVNTGGDSLLMVFDSVDGAVRCALNVQQQIPILDGDQPPDQVIRFRFGINVGDVIPDGTDIHGDVVNVAARLQAKCPPGGICVSRAVRDHVQDRLDLSFEELGSLDLRNISRPVEAFVLGLIAPGTVPRSIERSPNPRESLPLPDRPSIAVLPFTNMSGDAEQEYFADGIVEDITTALSHVKSLFVIARNSSFTYKGRAIDVKQVSRELGVRYVLEGSVRKAGNRVRITTQLIDATTGVHVGADRFDGLLGDIFALQDEVTSTVVGTLEPSLRGAEIERAQRKHTDSLHAYDLMLRALAHFRTYNHAAMVEAIRLLRMAAAIDPNYAMSFALHAHIVHLMTSQGWLSRPNPQIDEAVRLARLAVSLGKDDAEVLSTSAISIALPGGDLLGGLALSEQALFFQSQFSACLVRERDPIRLCGRHRCLNRECRTCHKAKSVRQCHSN